MAAAGRSEGIAAIVLAAGSSRRYGRDNKLLADFNGEPLIRRVVRQVAASRAGAVLVVTGHERERIEEALAGLRVALIHNARHAEGMGGSVSAGIAALGPTVTGALITPGDLPELAPELIDRLIATFEAAGSRHIVYPALPSGEQRNPVLWPQRLFAELARLTGDTGARALVRQHAGDALPIGIAPEAELIDIDEADDVARWQRSKAKPA